jgi:hypothetical protein
VERSAAYATEAQGPLHCDGDTLRRERLDAARWLVLDTNLDRIPWFLDRELYFQALDRFYRAFQGFLLALQVSRRTYPIAYNRWIREQVADNLGLPDLYEKLPKLFEFDRFEGRALAAKAAELRRLSRTTSSAESDPVGAETRSGGRGHRVAGRPGRSVSRFRQRATASQERKWDG